MWRRRVSNWRSPRPRIRCGFAPRCGGCGGCGGLRHIDGGHLREEVNAWRQRYVRARAAAGVAGFAEFDFRFENNQALVMRDVLGELAQVV